MDQLDYYSDRKFCSHCNDYVSYLMSVDHSYCVECGNEVRLFSNDDWTTSSFDLATSHRAPRHVSSSSTGTSR